MIDCVWGRQYVSFKVEEEGGEKCISSIFLFKGDKKVIRGPVLDSEYH